MILWTNWQNIRSYWCEIGQDSTLNKSNTLNWNLHIQRAEGSAQFERKWLHSQASTHQEERTVLLGFFVCFWPSSVKSLKLPMLKFLWLLAPFALCQQIYLWKCLSSTVVPLFMWNDTKLNKTVITDAAICNYNLNNASPKVWLSLSILSCGKQRRLWEIISTFVIFKA